MKPMLPSCLLAVCMIWLAGCASHPARHPSRSASNVRLGNVLQQEHDADAAYATGDMQRAALLYDRLVKAVPSEPDYWYRLGNARFRLQQPDEAVIDYGRAIALKPDHARAWHNLGIVRLKQAHAAMLASAQGAKTDEPLRHASERIATQLAHIGSVAPPPEAPLAATTTASQAPATAVPAATAAAPTTATPPGQP